MIQDIGDHTYHVEYRPVPLARDGILLSYRGREVLVKLTGEKSFTYPTYGDYDGLEANRFRWLFAEDSQQFYLADEALPEKDGFLTSILTLCGELHRVTWPLPASSACPYPFGTATTAFVVTAAVR